MITNDTWTMTNFGPVQIKSLMDHPHIHLAHDGTEEMYLSGYTFSGREHYLTIEAEGHVINVGMDQPIRLNGSTSLPARMLQKGNEIEVFPHTHSGWKGTGGTDKDGELIAFLMTSQDPLDRLRGEGIDILGENSQSFREVWFNPARVETSSSEFYKGYLREAVLKNVVFEDNLFSANIKEFDTHQLIRMLHRIGVHVVSPAPNQITIPSYSLRQLILTVGFGSQGAELFPLVENITAPTGYTVSVTNIVPSVTKGAPKDLYSTRGSDVGTFTEVNGFLVVTSEGM